MPEYDIALELARLHILTGADFVRQLKIVVTRRIAQNPLFLIQFQRKYAK